MAYGENPYGGSAAANKPAKQKLSKTVSQSFDKTKEVAAVGFEKTKEVAAVGYEKSKVIAAVGFEKSKVAAKKVKEGTSAGVNWLKLKYNKSKLSQKKY